MRKASPAVRWVSAKLAGFAFVASIASCSAPTQILVVVSRSPDLASIAVAVAWIEDGAGARIDGPRRFAVAPSGDSFAVIPSRGDPIARVTVVGCRVVPSEGADCADPVTTQRVQAHFVSNETVRVDLELAPSCDGVECPVDSVCRVSGTGHVCGALARSTGPDAGLGPGVPDLPVATIAGGASAVFDCVGSAAEPGGTALADLSVTLEDFVEATPSASVSVCFCDEPSDLFLAAVLTGAGCGSCEAQTTDTMGAIHVQSRIGGWYSLRVQGAGDLLDMVEINALASEAPPAVSHTIRSETGALLSSVAGFERAPGTALVLGAAVDCGADRIAGAVLRVVRAEGVVLAGSSRRAPFYAYLDSDLMTGPHTSESGLTIGGNMPVSSEYEIARVEVWADGGAGERRVGCETVPLLRDGATLVVIGPERNDYSAVDPCGWDP